MKKDGTKKSKTRKPTELEDDEIEKEISAALEYARDEERMHQAALGELSEAEAEEAVKVMREKYGWI